METTFPVLARQAPVPPRTQDDAVVRCLHDMARLLQMQGDTAQRVAACRRAARDLSRRDMPLRQLVAAAGLPALQQGLDIEAWVAQGIAEQLAVGCWQSLERLRGWADTEALLCTVPGVDAALAARIHDELETDSVDALEAALLAGRHGAMPGLAADQVSRLTSAVVERASRLRTIRRAFGERTVYVGPAVDSLLEIDRWFRHRAATGDLPCIEPRRAPPGSLARLPVLHAELSGWHFTALYANTARARRFGCLHDWVVIHAEQPSRPERASTLVTSGRGALAGRRVLLGREPECRQCYVAKGSARGGPDGAPQRSSHA
jgi:DNA polymerase (family X)